MSETRALVRTGEPPATAVEPSAARAVHLLRPIAEPADVIKAQDATRALVEKALVKDRDYGLIPGVKKQTLLKPGAERIALAFGVSSQYTVVEQEIDHDRKIEWTKRQKVYNNRHAGDKSYEWKDISGVSYGLYRYVVRCDLILRSTGEVVGSCIGACSTLEGKYVDRPRDSENTIVKMAQKRAQVGAVLVAFGLSDQFTQDVDDINPEADEEAPTIDADSIVTWGKAKGTALKDLDGYLEWATEGERKFGKHTELWQAAMRAELDRRRGTTPAAPPAAKKAPAPPQKQPEAGDVIHDGTGDPKVVDEPDCPECGGRMWDNRESKRNPKAPDYKCRTKTCEGVYWPGQWPPKEDDTQQDAFDDAPPARRVRKPAHRPSDDDFPAALEDEDDNLPF